MYFINTQDEKTLESIAKVRKALGLAIQSLQDKFSAMIDPPRAFKNKDAQLAGIDAMLSSWETAKKQVKLYPSQVKLLKALVQELPAVTDLLGKCEMMSQDQLAQSDQLAQLDQSDQQNQPVQPSAVKVQAPQQEELKFLNTNTWKVQYCVQQNLMDVQATHSALLQVSFSKERQAKSGLSDEQLNARLQNCVAIGTILQRLQQPCRKHPIRSDELILLSAHKFCFTHLTLLVDIIIKSNKPKTQDGIDDAITKLEEFHIRTEVKDHTDQTLLARPKSPTQHDQKVQAGLTLVQSKVGKSISPGHKQVHRLAILTNYQQKVERDRLRSSAPAILEHPDVKAEEIKPQKLNSL